MPRQIELVLERRGVSAVAELLEADAPLTAAAVWDALPQAGEPFHAKYARNELYILVPPFPSQPIGLENSTLTPIPGDLCYWYFAGSELPAAQRAANDGGVVDLALFYGRNNLLLNPDTGWVPANVFATVVD